MTESLDPSIVSNKIDLYNLLNVNDDCQEADIRRAYRKVALKYHPDKNPSEDAKVVFHNLNLALETLISNDLRKRYDQLRKSWVEKELRTRELDENRRRLQQELEAKEKENVERIKVSLDAKRKLELLKMEGLKRRRLHEEKMEKRLTGDRATKDDGKKESGSESEADSNTISEKSRTVKLRLRENSVLTSQQQIMKAFTKFGTIEQVVIVPKQKGKKYFSALIIFEGIDGAQLCVSKSFDNMGGDFKGVKSAKLVGKEKEEEEYDYEVKIDRNSSNYAEATMRRLEMLSKRSS